MNLKEKLYNVLVGFLVKITKNNYYLRNKIAVAILYDTKVIMNITISDDILVYNKMKLTHEGLSSGDIVTGCRVVHVPTSNAFVLKP